MPGAQDIYRLHHLRLSPAGSPLHEALSGALPGLSRQQARRALKAGLVTIDGKPVEDLHATVPRNATPAELDLRQGLRRAWVRVRHGAPAKPPELGMLHVDNDIVVVDKPAGVPSVPPRDDPRARGHVGDLLRVQLRRLGRETGYIGIVHRLDKETSGCLVVALTREAHRILASQFAGEAAVRTYRCLVSGRPAQESGTIAGKQGRGEDGRRALVDDDEAGVEAVTTYKLLKALPGGSLLEVGLGTGRTHQVRVALSSIGCPVLGDRVYGIGHAVVPVPRMMLHAATLEIDHPRGGNRLRIESPLPEAFARVEELLAAAPAAPSRPPRTR